MIKQRIVWGICLAGLFAFLFFSDYLFALVLLLITAIVPLVLTLINQFAGREVSISLEMPPIGEKNQQLICKINAINAKRLPLAPIKCKLKSENILTSEIIESEVFFPIGAKEEISIPFVMESEYCGCISIKVESLKVYDIFGLFAHEIPCEAKAEISILPSTFAPHLTVVPHMSKDVEADEYSQEKAGEDTSETFAIREYRPGDNLHRIHWKLSNKFDELMIKEPGLPVRHSFLVLFETSLSMDVEQNADISDSMAEIALSLCQAMTEEEITYEIGWQDHENGNFFQSRVTSLEELTGVVNKLLKARQCNDGLNALTNFYEAQGESSFEHILYVSPYLPDNFEQYVGESQTTGIICTRNQGAAEIDGGAGSMNMYFCSPENYEKELFALAI